MKLSTRILLAFAVVLILSIIDTLSNYILSLKVEENTKFLNRSQEIIRISARLHKEIIEMQSSFRGFLLTKESSLLKNYVANSKSIPTLFEQEQNLITSNPEQSKLLDSIRSLHSKWMGYSESSISYRQMSDAQLPLNHVPDPSFDNSLNNTFRKYSDEIIADLFAEFDRFEYNMRTVHAANLANSIRTAHVYSLTFFGLTIVIGIASTAYIITMISRRIKNMAELAENISRGKFNTVKDYHKDELARLSTSLNLMSQNLERNISELEKRNMELDKFAYVVSHDLKAPLRGIHNVISWIGEDMSHELSPQLKNYLEIISQRSNRMENLINGLLDYARIRKKKEPEKTDVGELIREVADEVVPKNFQVVINNPPVLFTEKLKLEQVFMNLFTNSVKYTNTESGEIVVTCEEQTIYYRFSVKDNGIGIDQQYHEKIFELFQTLREKTEKESTGMGLAIIKKIIEEMGGSIYVKSEPGKGAEFIFTWPKGIIPGK